jgi:hypothetical protein
MNASNKNPSDKGDWIDCPTGELQALGERLSSNHLRGKHMAAYRMVAASALVVLLAFGASQWLRPDAKLGGLTCGECFAQFNAYHKHLVTGGDAIDEALAVQMHDHLAQCEICRPKFEARFPGVLSNALRASGRLLAQRDAHVARLAVILL